MAQRHWRVLRRLPIFDGMRYLASKARPAFLDLLRRPLVAQDTTADGVLGPLPLTKAHRRAFGEYRPLPYPGRGVLLLAREMTGIYSADPVADWQGLAVDGVDVHLLPGDDEGLLKEPTVQLLSETLSTYLGSRRAEAR
jgi:hypothetical protein